MITTAQLLWNIGLGILLLIPAIQFDYRHYRRLRGRMFRWNDEKWRLSPGERQALNRFLLLLAVDLAGNAVLLAAGPLIQMAAPR